MNLVLIFFPTTQPNPTNNTRDPNPIYILLYNPTTSRVLKQVPMSTRVNKIKYLNFKLVPYISI